MTASSASASVLMQVEGLGKRYGDQRALSDISFAVHAGEVLGLIGPNGAGKTTLMEAIAGRRFPCRAGMNACSTSPTESGPGKTNMSRG